MISQADIIKALVNKNCTDESIMSVALSPDWTPAKLLEKFNEAERFDLALDVSMKLGLDVSPIWKTWALRCLKNRDFQNARDKFRHTFQRLRSTAARCSLLCDILNELTPMSETKLSLGEEIELIKNRGYRSRDNSDKARVSQRRASTIQSKPKILAECSYYLREYGTIEDNIKFLVRTSSWDQTVKILLDQSTRINVDKFFIVEIVLRASTMGSLDSLLDALIAQDPDKILAVKYYRAMYKHYEIHKRFNSLYYLQKKIGDLVGAAENLIKNFYLKRPTISYKELNLRVTKLTAASDNYKSHIEMLKVSHSERDYAKKESISQLFTYADKERSEQRLHVIDTQIEITKNFAINEVHGCMNHVELVFINPSPSNTSGLSCAKDDSSPVTLFEDDARRLTYLAALVLIYFDVDCRAYFSTSGLNLANQIISEYKLDKVSVFKTAMRTIIEDESCDIMTNAKLLTQRLTEDHVATLRRSKMRTNSKSQQKSSRHATIREATHIAEIESSNLNASDTQTLSGQLLSNKSQPLETPSSGRAGKPNPNESARILCDDVIRDSIRSCSEPDYRMKLTSLLSPEARIELFIELGILSNAQRLAFDMNRRDYVAIVLREAERLNQDHIKDVCQHWLAKH